MSTTANLESASNKPLEGSAGTSTPSTAYPYTKQCTVTIKPKQTTPKLPETGTDVNTAEFYIQKIGSSFAANGSTMQLGRTVLTREEEIAWFPRILAISPSHAEWDRYVDEYWKNLSVNVPIDGLTLNANLQIRHKDDIGLPENPVQYVLYRYCLKYNQVANNIEDVNKSPKIRFYMWTKEEDVQVKMNKQQLEDKAFAARLGLYKTPLKLESVILLFERELPSNDGDRKLLLAELQKTQPAKFLSLASDDLVLEKAFIQRCINAGLLRRPLNSPMVMHKETVIGNSLEESIAWLNKEDSTAIKADLQNKLKIIR